MKKKDPYIGLEMLLLILSIVGLFVLFFAMLKPIDSATPTSGNILKVVDDGKLSTEEFQVLKDMSCQDIKSMLGTRKNVCIYFKDMDGQVADLTNDGRFGIGCAGLEMDGQKICSK